MSNTDITADDANLPDPDEFDTDDLTNEYDHMLKLLDVAAQQAVYKLVGDGRVTDHQKEQARSKWANTLIKSVQTRRQVLESREIERMSREIEELREQRTERGWQ
ncbi:hypothetical protein [Halalkalicoccus salilacus]|uniref:hypothetical protein n=1 Tax=Halalkalicoccus TaxID=332246 RepID=UPI002F968A35